MSDDQVIAIMETTIRNSFPAGTQIAQSTADETAFVVAWRASPSKYGNLILPRARLTNPQAAGGPAGVMERFKTHTERLGAQLSIQIA